ncbi:MAG: AraC family transcriptional regulator [Solirubrobacterales bacterium]|nr:AraC family transcriptional regulator [Solirubrobacterales bacterium]
MATQTTGSDRGVLDPETGRAHFHLERPAPAPDLVPWVDRHWIVAWDLRGGAPFTQEVLSFPNVNLAIEPDTADVHGVRTGLGAHTIAGAGRVVGTKLRPGAWRALAGEPAWCLTDRVVPLEAAFGPQARGLVAEVRAATEVGDAVALVEAFLRRRLPEEPDPVAAEVAAVVDAMLASPAGTTVAGVAAAHGVSPRTLQRLFREHVGVSPKAVLQRHRLHAAAERIAQDAAHDWAALAVDLGYADQAHFINDFRAAIGRTPAQFAAACGGAQP